MHTLFDSWTAYENVKLALQLDGVRSAADMRERGVEMLERLGLGPRLDHKPPSLAGGQRERGGSARALAHRPGLVLGGGPAAAAGKEATPNSVTLLHDAAGEHGPA